MGCVFLKINNSKKAAIHMPKTTRPKWKDPGAKLYNTLLNAQHIVGNRVPDGSEEFEKLIKEGKYLLWQDFLKEAYLVAPVKNIQNSPYGVTPFSRSGCKYPHHVIKNGELVVSIPGLRAAYISARNEGCFDPDPSKRPPYSREVVKHFNRHCKELGLKPEWHYGEFYLYEESVIKIGNNFDDICQFIMERTGINAADDELILYDDKFLMDECEMLTENWIFPAKDFELNLDKWEKGNPLWITGSSGDGKSTLAEKYASDRKAEIVSIDIVLARVMYSEEKFKNIVGGGKSGEAHKIHTENSPAIDYVNSHPELPFAADDSIVESEMKKFLSWLLNALSEDEKYKNTLYIVEGCDICLMDPELMSDKPLIIVGGSRIRSLIRRAKRHKEKRGKPLITGILKYIFNYIGKNKKMDDNKDNFLKSVKSYESYNGYFANEPIDTIYSSAIASEFESTQPGKPAEYKRDDNHDALDELSKTMAWIECAANGDGELVDILFENMDQDDGYIPDWLYDSEDINYAMYESDDNSHTGVVNRNNIVPNIKIYKCGSSNKSLVPVYGVLKYTSESGDKRNDGTDKDDYDLEMQKFNKTIRMVTNGDNYGHALVSFDDTFRNLYSFGDEGVEDDDIMNDSWMGTSSIYVCVMFVEAAEHMRMKKFVEYLIDHKSETTYGYSNLITAYGGIPAKIDKRFVCSTFTSYILMNSNPKNLHRDYSRLRPEDITVLPRSFYVSNFKDRDDFIARRDMMIKKVDAIFNEYEDEIDDYNNHLPKLLLSDRVDKLKFGDKILDYFIKRM